MKHLAFIVSFYIFSMTVTPAVRIMYAKFSSEHCKKPCSENSDSKNDTDGCEKQSCSPFSGCLKLQVLIPILYKNSNLFQTELVIKNNFNLKQLFFSLRNFDIWHPPKFI